MVARVLERTGATVWSLGAMYMTVAQLVLLYGSKRWVVTEKNAQGLEGVPPPGRAMDHGADSKVQGRRRVGVTLGSGVTGRRGDPPHRGVHQDTAGNHSGKGDLLPHK